MQLCKCKCPKINVYLFPNKLWLSRAAYPRPLVSSAQDIQPRFLLTDWTVEIWRQPILDFHILSAESNSIWLLFHLLVFLWFDFFIFWKTTSPWYLNIIENDRDFHTLLFNIPLIITRCKYMMKYANCSDLSEIYVWKRTISNKERTIYEWRICITTIAMNYISSIWKTTMFYIASNSV